MLNWFVVGFLALITPLIVFQEFIVGRFINSIYEYPYFNWKKSVFAAICQVGILAVCMELSLPTFFLYALFFLCFLTEFSCLLREFKLSCWFWVCMRTIFFASAHIAFLSFGALFRGVTLRAACHRPWLWASSVFFACLFTAVLVVLQKKHMPPEAFRILTTDTKRVRQLVLFEWFALFYILFDSVPFLYHIPYAPLAWFQIGSSLLLCLQLAIFTQHAYNIARDARYEQEYYRLETERSDQIKREMDLRSLAYLDSLTGAYTRRYAVELLNSLLNDGRALSLAYIDLNGLKQVNDTMGHGEGDRYILSIVHELGQRLGPNDVLARVGGDEFMIIAPGSPRARLSDTMELANGALCKRGEQASFSFGVSEITADGGVTAEELIRIADVRMYEYKKRFHQQEKKGGGANCPNR